MPNAMTVEKAGGPEAMRWGSVEVGAPGKGEARLRHTAIGVNFIDVYYRGGLYPPPGGYPFIPGAEGAGVVEAVGEGVTDLKPGDRVVYQGAIGAYSEARLHPADRLVKLPDGIDDKAAAAGFLKGLTVSFLVNRTFKVKKEHTILWHAAAGGVGSIAAQWVKSIGATLIGTVGSDDKIGLAKAHGCDHVINYRKENFALKVRELTGGEGVEAVYDSVGADTFPGSLDCLKPMGMWVSFGQSSGIPPAFQTSLLQQKGALFATRPTLMVYAKKRADLDALSADLFSVLRSGAVKIPVNLTLPLKDAVEAHRKLEARETTGTTVLLP